MCDIVNSPCIVCKCDLPLHLGDYETAPEEVECYCQDHLPTENVRIFTLTEDEINTEYKYTWPGKGQPATRERIGETVEYSKGWKMGIRSLTDNAREFKDYNHPNVGADYTVEDI